MKTKNKLKRSLKICRKCLHRDATAKSYWCWLDSPLTYISYKRPLDVQRKVHDKFRTKEPSEHCPYRLEQLVIGNHTNGK